MARFRQNTIFFSITDFMQFFQFAFSILGHFHFLCDMCKRCFIVCTAQVNNRFLFNPFLMKYSAAGYQQLTTKQLSILLTELFIYSMPAIANSVEILLTHTYTSLFILFKLNRLLNSIRLNFMCWNIFVSIISIGPEKIIAIADCIRFC